MVMGRPPTSQPLPSLPCHKPKTKLRVLLFSLTVSFLGIQHCDWLFLRKLQVVCRPKSLFYKAAANGPCRVCVHWQVEEEKSTRLPSEVMLRLKAFLEQFLGDSYGLLMESMQKFLRQGLEPDGMTAQDFQRFTRLAKLCTAYTFLQQVLLVAGERLL